MRIVFIAATVLAAVAGNSAAQGKPVKPADAATLVALTPTVIDATGKAIGTYAPTGIALLKFTGGVIAITLQPVVEGGVQHSSQVRYAVSTGGFFSSGNCSGTPVILETTFVTPPGGGSPIYGTRAVAYISDSGGQVTAYIANNAFSTPRSLNSIRQPDGSCTVLSSPLTSNGYDVGTTMILPPGPLTVQ